MGIPVHREKDRHSEADLQFEFAYQLRLRNIKFKLEHVYKDCRFDLVVGSRGKVNHIVEFKRADEHGMGNPKFSTHKKQRMKYLRFKNAKLHWVYGRKTFKKALKEISGDRNYLVAYSKNVQISDLECLMCSYED